MLKAKIQNLPTVNHKITIPKSRRYLYVSTISFTVQLQRKDYFGRTTLLIFLSLSENYSKVYYIFYAVDYI